MKDLELKIKTHLLKKRITDIEFYNINDSYLVFDPDSRWVFDGGIQIKFADEVFSYGWDYSNGGFDYSLDRPIENLFGEADFYNVEAENIEGIATLIGSEISDVEVKWEYYQEFDDDGELKDEKIYVPVGLKLTFKCNSILQLAIIHFGIKKEPFQIVNAEYSLDGRLLISLNEILEIRNSNA